MAISETEVRDALSAVKYPGFSRDIVSFGLVKGISIDRWRRDRTACARDK